MLRLLFGGSLLVLLGGCACLPVKHQFTPKPAAAIAAPVVAPKVAPVETPKQKTFKQRWISKFIRERP